METLKTIMIAFSATIVVIRWVRLGFIISKHGEEKPKQKYNGFSYFFGILVWSLIAISLYYA